MGSRWRKKNKAVCLGVKDALPGWEVDSPYGIALNSRLHRPIQARLSARPGLSPLTRTNQTTPRLSKAIDSTNKNGTEKIFGAVFI